MWNISKTLKKMSFCFFSMKFAIAIFIIFLTMPSTDSQSAYYTLCSSNPVVSCGNITNVGYPFWGGDRPKFCGRPEFSLFCQSNTSNPLILLGTADNGALNKASVIDVNVSSHTMLLVEEQFSKFQNNLPCWLMANNSLTNLSPAFKFGKLVSNISLLFDCGPTVSNFHLKSLTCSQSSGNKTGFYVDKPSDANRIGKSCGTVGKFPVLKSELDELNDGTVTLLNVLKKGFEVDYEVNFTACLSCQNSGGMCGSPDDPLLFDFVCYCQDGPHPLVCPKSVSGKKKSMLILGICIGVGIVILLALIGMWYCKLFKFFKKRSVALHRSSTELEPGSIYFGVPLFSYTELENATDNFHHTKELGGGGFGTVYYGKLRDGREVAVKRLYEKSYKRMEQFMNEVQLLTCLRHQNLVSLYGCTSCDSRELLLVYEYVANGTVADHLYGDKAKSRALAWPIRLKIAVETASALAYLHASDVIHRDVKTTNILLDSSFSVKVADFGLSRLFPTDVTHVSTAPQGTPGYLDPEYNQCYQLTDKSDVYSFGIVLAELISSLPAVDMNRHRYEINLSNYAMNRIQRCAFDDLIDPQLGFASDPKVRRTATSVAELAFQCLQHYKDFRPSMDEVLEVLKRIESSNYKALQVDDKSDVTAEQNTDSLPSLAPIVDAKVSSKHHQRPHSPISVMDISSSSSTSQSNHC